MSGLESGHNTMAHRWKFLRLYNLYEYYELRQGQYIYFPSYL